MSNNPFENIKFSLLTLKEYEIEAYDEEINEIFDCIVENRQYDNSRLLSRFELAYLLQSLGEHIFHSDSPKRISLSKLTKLISQNDFSLIQENDLRFKIRKLLLES